MDQNADSIVVTALQVQKFFNKLLSQNSKLIVMVLTPPQLEFYSSDRNALWRICFFCFLLQVQADS